MIIYWMRNDLRLHDNECLHNVVKSGKPFLPVFCFDPRHFRKLAYGFRKTGYLRYRFLSETIVNLRQKLQAKDGNLLICRGKPEVIIPELVRKFKASEVIFQKEIASEETNVEDSLIKQLEQQGCQWQAIWGKTLYHIDDAPFKPVDTPLTSKAFRMQLAKQADVRPLFSEPDVLSATISVNKWGVIPTASSLGFSEEDAIIGDIPVEPKETPRFEGGETAGLSRLRDYTFESELLTSYRWTRNRSLGMAYSSKFSPWMALGSLSPRKIYWEIKRYEKEVKKNISTWWLIFELVWRDYFKYSALRHGNKIFALGGIKNRQTKFSNDQQLFDRWRWGQTGIPFVDAHMRQLNLTGFMSNRGRVNCASFLARDYQIDWRWGAAWFEKQLLDYDVCSNWLNWSNQALEEWYTNPVHQGLKYDKEGRYVKKWLPELQNIDGPIVQAPWLINNGKVSMDTGYPLPDSIYEKWSRSIKRIQKAQDTFAEK